MDLRTVSAKTMPAIGRCKEKGGLGPFAKPCLLTMFFLAPIITNMATKVLNSALPGLTGGKFSLPGNLQMIGLSNHLTHSLMPFTLK